MLSPASPLDDVLSASSGASDYQRKMAKAMKVSLGCLNNVHDPPLFPSRCLRQGAL